MRTIDRLSRSLPLMVALAALPLSAQAVERPTDGYYAQPRVEFAFEDAATVRLEGRDFRSSLKWDYADVEALLRSAGAEEWSRMFASSSPEHLDELRKTGEARRGIQLPNLNNWYTVVVSDDAAAEELAAALAKNPRIRSASATPIPQMDAADIAPATPNYAAGQDYQDAAPYGTGIAAGWAETGGDGAGIRILHCEGGWVVDHEDFDLTYTGGGNSTDPGWWNHGTACVSILGARSNGYGVTGMTANLDGLLSRGINDFGGPDAWIASMTYLVPGDVISASWGYSATPAPGQVCVCNCAQFGGLAAETNQADFDAIQTVTANGYIVVNSASNGSMPLDDPYYNGKWDLNVRDSGALLIGAIDPGGVPTCWTNHGSRIDAHAWGSSVVSAGYGDLFTGGGDTRQYYTSTFGGTSSACPIVSGCVASLQGIYKAANGGAVLDAWQFRTLLRTTGTDQTGDFAKNVSNMPDMVQLIAAIGTAPDVTPPTIVHAPLGNTGDETGPYVVSATITDASGVVEATVHYSIDGGGWAAAPLADQGGDVWAGSIPGQPAGSVVDYYVWARDGADPANEATDAVHSFTVLTSADGIVLLTPSASLLSSGAEWEAALTAAGYPGTIMNVDNLDGVVLGSNTDALIVLLGIYSNNFVVPAGSPMATAIVDFASSGGKVYMEGGDCWYYDPGFQNGQDFGPVFGLSSDADGTSDLSSATGHGPLSGSWAYAGENNWIDHLQSAGASLLFSNDAAGYDCGFYQTGAQTTAGVSFELAGLSDFPAIVETLFGEALFDVFVPELAFSPALLTGTAMAGGTDSDLLTLTNVGGSTLNWTARVSGPVFATAQTVHPKLELAKGEADPRPGSAISGFGATGDFYYTWIDSDEPGGPAVNFQDISGTGTALTMSDDDNQGPFPLGFGFEFFTNVYNEVRVCSNGFIAFQSTSAAYSNAPIPSAGQPEGFVAPFWDDLNPSNGGTVHVQAFADRFVVQWTAVARFSGTGVYTFQTILHDDNSIEYQYGELTGATDSATVGIENILDNAGLQIVYNAPYLHSDMAIRIAPWLSVAQFSGSLAPGASVDLPVGMDAAALEAGVYNASVLVTSNTDPGFVYVPAEFTVTAGPRQPAPISGIQWTWTDSDDTDHFISFDLSFPPVTQDVDGNPLVVDHYAYYYAFEADGSFPANWIQWTTTTAPFLSVSWATSDVDPNGFVIITAIDQDGVVVASSRPGLTGGEQAPARIQPAGATVGPIVR